MAKKGHGATKVGAAIEAVADSADFEPAYRGEEWVTLTFRVQKSQAAIPGIWHLTPICPGTRDWAHTKFPAGGEA